MSDGSLLTVPVIPNPSTPSVRILLRAGSVRNPCGVGLTKVMSGKLRGLRLPETIRVHPFPEGFLPSVEMTGSSFPQPDPVAVEGALAGHVGQGVWGGPVDVPATFAVLERV
jgi:hypothetical protein